jgi:hypothetical protein
MGTSGKRPQDCFYRIESREVSRDEGALTAVTGNTLGGVRCLR